TATEEWLKEEDFGEPIQGKNNWMNEMLTAAVGNVPGQLEQAKSVYYYVENHFNCTNFENPYIKTGLHEMPKKGEGSVGDINLLLIAMLRKQGIKADPVLLSTRDHGFSYVQYPVVNKFNYVIVRAVVEGNVYFLDAAHRNLGFGKLMENCYNGHARIISEKDSASVYFWPDSLREKKITMVQIMSNEKGVLEGNYQSILGNSESLITREKMNEIGQTAYFKNIQTTNEKEFEIKNTGIDSLDKLEEPVKIYYDFRLKTELGTSIIYINPMFTEALSKNPLNSMERKYPVEMPYIVDEKYILNMDIPTGYAVDELPKSATVSFNGNQGFFEYSIRASESHIQLRCVFKLIKTNFLAKDYNNLRDLFAFMIKKENELIVLKKNNK
ncbi:MAG TPA: transglutaminase domain-containing protein, partial [Puia sp.]|nr:transglutaminase domain-containing protein [Puia sp.]